MTYQAIHQINWLPQVLLVLIWICAGYWIDPLMWLLLLAHVVLLSIIYTGATVHYYIKDGIIIKKTDGGSNSKTKHDHQLIRLITKIYRIERDGHTVALRLYRNEYEKDAQTIRVKSIDKFLNEILAVHPDIPITTRKASRCDYPFLRSPTTLSTERV